MEWYWSKNEFWFHKGFSAQHGLPEMLEKWERSVDQGKVFGVLLTGLSKAFDYLPYELIMAKLIIYAFS